MERCWRRRMPTQLVYLRRGPELVVLIGEGPQTDARFEEWFRAGMEVLEYSPEGARYYFATESLKALSSVEHALSGVPLRQVARQIKPWSCKASADPMYPSSRGRRR